MLLSLQRIGLQLSKMGEPTYWFDFKDERISGWVYFLRILIGIILTVLIIPGPLLISSTVYKRSGSLNWPFYFRIISSILLPLCVLGLFYGWFLLDLLEFSPPFLFLFVSGTFTVFISMLHFTLLFTESKISKTNIGKKFDWNESSYSNSLDQESETEEEERYARLKELIFQKFLNKAQSRNLTIENDEIQTTSELSNEFDRLIKQEGDSEKHSEEKPCLEDKGMAIKSDYRYDYKLSDEWVL